MDENLKNKIVQEVMNQLAAYSENDETEPIELESKEIIGIENPHNIEALKVMRSSTPARILIGRAGTRQKTGSLLNFLADHAAAVDAVFTEVSEELLKKHDLFSVQTVVVDKNMYLMKPESGKKLTEESRNIILEKCPKKKKVQLIIVDGLSSTAIENNLDDILPAFTQGLKTEGIEMGVPFFVKYGRVGVEDEIGKMLDCDVVVQLIGERPGLTTAESLSAYIIYRPNDNTVEADRTVISNIHKGGTPPAEAGAHLATVVKTILNHKASGVKLSERLKNQ